MNTDASKTDGTRTAISDARGQPIIYFNVCQGEELGIAVAVQDTSTDNIENINSAYTFFLEASDRYYKRYDEIEWDELHQKSWEGMKACRTATRQDIETQFDDHPRFKGHFVLKEIDDNDHFKSIHQILNEHSNAQTSTVDNGRKPHYQ
ncbi:hypothetical protein I302_100897 [Kwoniella bestiolae CBS 10118]|uniref:Uncharacterized protein n=1 Tax=Kwoniella bestiolae CBS 10118 TaxID=1296100 RepID=A0A1B9G6C7_9TREE|nr:hypothetical protein I302_04271 [Kwoniella bestiolae CBS 10118]OCF26585.1 hypothetical protein I302_04271 [Kwoniella bestiolae CBS 10118]